jgi:hypothetical protein
VRTLSIIVLLVLTGASSVEGQPVLESRHGASLPEYVPQPRLALINMALSGTLSAAKTLIEGNADSGMDVMKSWGAGAVAGLGFFEAKRLAGEGLLLPAMALAHTSASIARNASDGKHPLSRFCAGIAVVDACFASPFDTGEDPPITVELNLLSILATATMPLVRTAPGMQHGVLIFEATAPLGHDGNLIRKGVTFGRIILLGPEPSPVTRNHEMIHVIQAIQMTSVTPYLTAGHYHHSLRSDRSLGFTRIRLDMQLDWLFLAAALANMTVSYARQWPEIEAHTLTRPAGASSSGTHSNRR